MSNRFGRPTWSLLAPDDWMTQHDEECATLADPEGIGALQLSAAFKDTKVDDADLRDLASEHLDAGAIPAATTLGDFVGFEIAYCTDESAWRTWYLRNDQQALFVTYNCTIDNRGLHDQAVDEILQSLSNAGVET